MTQLAEPEVISLTLPTIIATHTQPLRITATATRRPSATPTTSPTPFATSTLVASPSPFATKTPQPSPTAVIKYTVQAGDTLSQIAAKFDISLTDLLEANPEQDPSLLSINDVLIIPAHDELKMYIVQHGDTLLGIALEFGVSLKELQAANTDLDPTRLEIGNPILVPNPSQKKE